MAADGRLLAHSGRRYHLLIALTTAIQFRMWLCTALLSLPSRCTSSALRAFTCAGIRLRMTAFSQLIHISLRIEIQMLAAVYLDGSFVSHELLAIAIMLVAKVAAV